MPKTNIELGKGQHSGRNGKQKIRGRGGMGVGRERERDKNTARERERETETEIERQRDRERESESERARQNVRNIHDDMAELRQLADNFLKCFTVSSATYSGNDNEMTKVIKRVEAMLDAVKQAESQLDAWDGLGVLHGMVYKDFKHRLSLVQTLCPEIDEQLQLIDKSYDDDKDAKWFRSLLAMDQEPSEIRQTCLVSEVVKLKGPGDIINLLLKEDPTSYQYPVSIVPVGGMLGFHKATLVMDVCLSDRVTEHFDKMLRIDFIRAETFKDTKETKVKSIYPTNSGLYLESGKNLYVRLKELMLNTKSLLILDNFETADPDFWIDVLEALLSASADCKPGSKILVTSSTSFNLDCQGRLHPYECLAFFERIAYGQKKTVGREDWQPAASSREICFNCGYNLYAVKVIASILSTEVATPEIFNKDVLKCVKEPAKLFCNFSPEVILLLKYTLLFPSDHKFSKVDLQQLWEIEGQTDSPSMKETFDNHFDNLLENGFFIEDEERDRTGAVLPNYRIQILVHHVLKYVISDAFCSMATSKDLSDVSSKDLQHVSFTVDSLPGHPPPRVRKNSRARNRKKDFRCSFDNWKSLFVLSTKPCSVITTPDLGSILKSNTKLEALDLSNTDCREYSSSILCLRSLRYLRLGVSDKSLVYEVTKLKFLQTLDLRHSRTRELPDKFHELQSLRHLYVGDKLIDLPPNFEKLTKLQTLDVFIVGKNSLKALFNLVHIAGKLNIICQKAPQMDASDRARKWLVNRKLDQLSVERFPQWAMVQLPIFLRELVSIEITDCNGCQHLPSFGSLQLLQSLELRGLNDLEWIEQSDENSMASSSTEVYFPSLKYLILVNLAQLKRWSKAEKQDAVFGLLSDVKISGCPQLMSMPQMPQLQSLEASNFNTGLFQKPQLPIFQSLEASNKASNIHQNLRSLTLANILMPRDLSMCFDCLPALEELCLSWLADMSKLPESIGNLKQLGRLAIRYLTNLAELPKLLGDLPKLKNLQIQYCPKLKHLGDLPKLKNLDCPKLKHLPTSNCGHLELEIKECVLLDEYCQSYNNAQQTHV